jgi:hypothetical protein
MTIQPTVDDRRFAILGMLAISAAYRQLLALCM